jgi:hypothetical protein
VLNREETKFYQELMGENSVDVLWASWGRTLQQVDEPKKNSFMRNRGKKKEERGRTKNRTRISGRLLAQNPTC